MIINEAVILAGGLGTRLRDTVPGIPKCLAPVAGRPFLYYLINYLRSQGVSKFIFSLGYKSEMVVDYLGDHFKTLDYQCVVEDEPLGTGGAIHRAISVAKDNHILVANGDTFFRADVGDMYNLHIKKQSACTLALKPMKDFERYGVVDIDHEGRITAFREKQFYSRGLINGGVYIINKEKFLSHKWPEKFSFEKDYLEKFTNTENLYGFIQEGYFIDIGIADDYEKANNDFRRNAPVLKNIDSSWTVFIDRDGVINKEKKGEYILRWDEFEFYPGVKEAFSIISKKIGKILIVTNQRGVGRQLMTEQALLDIHQKMEDEIRSAGGRIDNIYYCTSTDNFHSHRKPNPGMAFQAAREIDGIDLSKSIMIGNKPGDMAFGRAAGMYTVFIRSTDPAFDPHPDIDFSFDSLGDFAKAL